MAEWLQGRGHQVRVVTAPPYYPAWKVGAGYRGWSYRRESLHGVDVFRCPLWVPESPNGFRRLLHLLSFAVSSIPVMLRQIFWRPDRIFVIEPTLFCAPCALVTARLANAKAWLHIQDFEAEAFFGLGFWFRRLRQKVRQRGRRLADAPVRPRLQHLAANGGKTFRVRDPRRSDIDLSQLGGYRPDPTGRPRARLSGGMGSGARSQDCVVCRQHGEQAGARDGAGNRQGLAERRPG